MSLTRKIAHNTIIQIIGKVISVAIGLTVASMLFRYLGREGYGNYTTVIVFLQFFGILVDMGLYIILTKKISEPDTNVNSLVSNVFTLRLISALVFLGLAPILVLFFPYPLIIKTGVAIASLSFLFITLNQVLQGVFQKNLKMEKVTIAEIVGRLVLLGGTFLAIYLDQGLLTILIAVVAGSLVNFLFTFFWAKKLVLINLKFDFVVWKQIAQEALPIALAIFFNLVYFKADTLLLSLLKSQSDVGIYGAPYKVLEVLTTIPAMFAGLAMPVLTAAYAQKNMERFRRVLNKAFDFLVLMAVPMAVGTYFLAKPIMLFIGGQEFEASGPVLQIIIIATATIFVGTLFGNAVVAVNQQKKIIWAYAGIAIVSVAGYLILIPRYTYFGAAWVTVASELLITASSIYVVYRATKIIPSLNLFFKTILASVIMGVMLFLFQGQSLFLLLILSPLVYVLTLYFLKAISKETLLEIIRIKDNETHHTP